MNATYPNLELIEYRTHQLFSNEKKNNPLLDITLIIFPQIWGSTCTGFDVMPDGEPVFSGCSMTKEYTTIVYVKPIDIYVVFFGNKPAYTVSNPNELFLSDLTNRNMAPVSQAKKRYHN